MSENGVGLMRVQVSWKKVQPTEGDCEASLPIPGVPVPGACDWSYYDRIVGGAAAAGVEVMPYLLTVPEWISKDENTPPIHSDADRAAWTEWLAGRGPPLRAERQLLARGVPDPAPRRRAAPDPPLAGLERALRRHLLAPAARIPPSTATSSS